MDDAQGPTTLEPGSSPGGMPLKLHIDEARYRALERIAASKHTTPAALVEALVRNALEHATVPPPATPAPRRSHTTYEEATRGFTRDREDTVAAPVE